MATFGERVVGALQADVATLREIEADPSAMGQAIAVIVLAGVAALIGNIFRGSLGGAISSLIIAVIGYAVWSVLIVLIGTKLMPEPTTKADFAEAFRVISFSAAPGFFNVLAIIPFLGPLISWVLHLWMIIIGVVAVREVLDYSNTARAIIVCLIAFCVYWIIRAFVLIPIFVARAVTGL